MKNKKGARLIVLAETEAYVVAAIRGPAAVVIGTTYFPGVDAPTAAANHAADAALRAGWILFG
jgi:hypothetical protein